MLSTAALSIKLVNYRVFFFFFKEEESKDEIRYFFTFQKKKRKKKKNVGVYELPRVHENCSTKSHLVIRIIEDLRRETLLMPCGMFHRIKSLDKDSCAVEVQFRKDKKEPGKTALFREFPGLFVSC